MVRSILIALALCMYVLPAAIAAYHKHRQTRSIILLSLILGWTGLGWLVTLIWALRDPQKLEPIARPKSVETIGCPACRSSIDPDASTCPHCQTTLGLPGDPLRIHRIR